MYCFDISFSLIEISWPAKSDQHSTLTMCVTIKHVLHQISGSSRCDQHAVWDVRQYIMRLILQSAQHTEHGDLVISEECTFLSDVLLSQGSLMTIAQALLEVDRLV